MLFGEAPGLKNYFPKCTKSKDKKEGRYLKLLPGSMSGLLGESCISIVSICFMLLCFGLSTWKKIWPHTDTWKRRTTTAFQGTVDFLWHHANPHTNLSTGITSGKEHMAGRQQSGANACSCQEASSAPGPPFTPTVQRSTVTNANEVLIQVMKINSHYCKYNIVLCERHRVWENQSKCYQLFLYGGNYLFVNFSAVHTYQCTHV